MFRNSYNKGFFFSLLLLIVVLYSFTTEQISYYIKVKDSNMIVLKEDYRDFWGHLSGGEATHPNNETGTYLILNPNQPNSKTEYTCQSTYYIHRWEFDYDEFGIWYTNKDTIILVPKNRFYYSTVRSTECPEEIVTRCEEYPISELVQTKKLVYDGEIVKDVTVYPIDPMLVDIGYSDGWEGEFPIVRQYVVKKNARLLKQIIRGLSK